MVEEAHAKILEGLGKPTLSLREKLFLEEEDNRFRRFRSLEAGQSTENENPEISLARQEIQEIIKEAGVSEIAEQVTRKNLKVQEESPENSILRLLPVKSQSFGRVVNALRRTGIETRDQLAAISIDEIQERLRKHKMQGPKTVTLVLAMRNLAIAEMRGRSSRENT